ncbi:MAG: SIMPL domain-containing protein [Saprospiraceae bacterium]|nr:SIMPL domain-containing protein [Saprospiraceae bacterium]
MQKILSLLLLVTFIYPADNLYAQASGNYRAKDNYNSSLSNPASTYLPNAKWIDNKTMVLEINALYNKKPDAQVAIFNITQVGQNADETVRLLNERYKGFVNEVQRLGIDQNDIHLDMITFLPVYEYEVDKKVFSTNYNEIPKGFEIQQNVHIKFASSKLLPQLVTLAARYEIYDLVRVDYFVEDHEAIFKELRKRSIDHMSKEIVLLVDELGVEIDAAHRIVSEDRYIAFPEDRYSGYQAFTSSSLEAKRGKVTNVRKPTTMFYDKVPYNKFDIVVNSTIVEPAVQFMYNMKIKFVVEDGRRIQKEYIWMTPEGELKKIPVQN